jgi:hypothetical protein
MSSYFEARSQIFEKLLLASLCLSNCQSFCLSAWNNLVPTLRLSAWNNLVPTVRMEQLGTHCPSVRMEQLGTHFPSVRMEQLGTHWTYFLKILQYPV